MALSGRFLLVLLLLGVAAWFAACDPPEHGAAEAPRAGHGSSGDDGADGSAEASKSERFLSFAPPASGEEVERRIEPGTTHVVPLELEGGSYLRAAVEQLGVDVEVLLRDATEVVMAVDSPTGTRGPEVLEVVLPRSDGRRAAAVETGERATHRLEIRVFEESTLGGSYRLRLVVRPDAGEEEHERAAAARIFHAAEAHRRAGRLDEAVALHTEALERRRVFHRRWGGDRVGEGESLERLGRLAARRGDHAAASGYLHQAAALFAAHGAIQLHGIALHRLADSHYATESLDLAATTYQQSLPSIRASHDAFSEALVLNNLGHIRFVQGRSAEAIGLLEAAAEKWAELGRPLQRGQSLQNLASLHAVLGNEERALDLFAEAESLLDEHGSDRDRAVLQNEIGQALRDQGRLGEALERFERSLALRRRLTDARGEAVTRTSLGEALIRRGEQALAREHLARALDLLGDGDPRNEARVLELLGESALANNDFRTAREHFERALSRLGDLDDPHARARLRTGAGRALWRQGELEEALVYAEGALAHHEELRSGARREDLQAAYAATLEEPYELVIQILVDLSRGEPAAGHAARALAYSELSRSRSLLRALRLSGAELAAGIDPELHERERRVLAAVAKQERLLASLPGARPLSHDGRQRASAQLRKHLGELAAVRERMRAGSPRYASLTREEPPSIPALRREVLDSQAYLLEYELAAERSLLWVLGPETLTVHSLPPEAELDKLGRELHGLLARSHRREAIRRTEQLACRASRLLLAPALAEIPAGAPVLVVAEDALQYIPFGALPLPGNGPASNEPCASGRPLLSRHPVVTLPSASALLAIRDPRQAARRARGGLAVVADPVFSRRDPRFPARRGGEGETVRSSLRGPSGSGAWSWAEDLPRLASSRREADAILALARSAATGRGGAVGPVFSAFGFEARRELLSTGQLAPYGIIHVATHGRLVTDFPELSGLAFSFFDQAGEPRDGVLRAPELFGLHLPARLVVLSACSTALGREVRGEGIVGLTRGFFHAGAARVLVSLWDVDDAATAELMQTFYRRMLGEGETPAEALRAAQLEIAGRPGREAPYFWAGFVLQGEWK